MTDEQYSHLNRKLEVVLNDNPRAIREEDKGFLGKVTEILIPFGFDIDLAGQALGNYEAGQPGSYKSIDLIAYQETDTSENHIGWFASQAIVGFMRAARSGEKFNGIDVEDVSGHYEETPNTEQDYHFILRYEDLTDTAIYLDFGKHENGSIKEVTATRNDPRISEYLTYDDGFRDSR